MNGTRMDVETLNENIHRCTSSAAAAEAATLITTTTMIGYRVDIQLLHFVLTLVTRRL